MPETMPFPPLFKLAETGAVIQWTIRVDKDDNGQGVIVTRWGQEGGSFQETHEAVTFGKNVGKKNETTAYEQACKDAQSKWEKQQKARKYTTSREAALAGERSDLVQGGYDCMLAFPIEKKPKALKMPCAVQRKYDGHRLLAVLENGVCTLWSRTRKPVNSLPHIQRALEKLFPTGSFLIDGEAYTMAVSFEELTSFIRSDEPKPGHEVVEYHVFDTNRENMKFEYRLELLHDWLDNAPLPLVLAPTVICKDEAEMNVCFQQFLDAGYEGAMARNLDGMYVGKHTPDLLKLKKFDDAEFTVVGVESEERQVVNSEGVQTMVYARFTCVGAPHGQKFTCTLNGDQATQKAYLANSAAVIGRLLTVKFQGYTADGLPRFPKGLRFREDA